MGIGWDPSQAVTNCKICGCSIEAWLSACDDCIEKEFKKEQKQLKEERVRMNKTVNNFKTVWEQLDKASGELYNALDALSSMSGLSEDLKRLGDMIDVTRVDMLKNEIEALIEAKGGSVEDLAVKAEEKPGRKVKLSGNGNKYITGSYRLWKNSKGGIGIKLDGAPELYNFPKGTELHDRINFMFLLEEEKEIERNSYPKVNKD